jgi:hypothetical protein
MIFCLFNSLLKSDVKDGYYIELAREISEFLDLKMKDYHGLMSLVDLYCLYNRMRSTGKLFLKAKGLDLISPEDLEKACQYLATHSSYAMVTFTTGTKLVHSSQKSIDKMIQTVTEWAKECQHGFDSMEASQRLNLSLSVTEEIIMVLPFILAHVIRLQKNKDIFVKMKQLAKPFIFPMTLFKSHTEIAYGYIRHIEWFDT